MCSCAQCRRFLVPFSGDGHQKTAPFSGDGVVRTMRRFLAPFYGTRKRRLPSAEGSPPFSGAVFWIAMSPKQATVVKQEKNMNLIEAVRRYPFLYDKKEEGFKDAVKKIALWSEIAEEVEVEDPKTRWENLRDHFFDEEDVFPDRPQSSLAASMTDVADSKQDNRKRKRSNVETVQSSDKLDEFLDRAMQPESGNEIFGKFVASEMDGLSPVNQVHAKQSISQLLTQFKLKELAPQIPDSQHPFVSGNGMDYSGGYLQL
ncbi:alcohol dehydrogenase transcription factor myb/SANT-like domain-containing protein [Ditylenchus destructor]|nr:alcohol dehydrogenase transcription factor myb/SANT-like domain-containing protein [Ditylenchus destructor]